MLEAPLSPVVHDPDSGDDLRTADFSSVTTPGDVRLEIAGLASDTFPIRRDAYADALRLATRAFYGQRCGCAVDLGGGYKHPPCHLQAAFHPSSGRTGELHNAGGWHDAGDYGRYVVNSGITTGTLLWAWELFPAALHPLRLDIPESGHSPTPDFLSEVRWNLDWMLSLQDPADGGVWHKQTSERFCAFIMPQDDHLTSYIIGTGSAPFKSTCATADLASVAAIGARCYKPFDPAFASRCLAAARKAFAWAVANPNVPFRNPPGVATGEYGDPHCSDELLWAAAELFRTTGEPEFEQFLLRALQHDLAGLTVEAPSWGNVRSMALWTYALMGHGQRAAKSASSADLTARVVEATDTAAAALIARSQSSGYGSTLQPADYTWGSNSTAGNHALLLLLADRFQRNPAAVEAALGNLHYLLGRNCFGVSWVTQLGTRPFQHPHHRPSAADGIVAPWPGLLSGGPNAHGGDPVADALAKAPPMRMWLDDQRAYSVNEVAINWNAPLVFLLAAANDPSVI
jgi:endoglucanase